MAHKMDYESEPWKVSGMCNRCRLIPDRAPMYECGRQHKYCKNCFLDMQTEYSGNVEEGAVCIICGKGEKFAKSHITSDFLHNLKQNQGIGQSSHPYQFKPEPKMTLEKLFGMPKTDVDKLLNTKIAPPPKPNADDDDDDDELPEYMRHDESPRPSLYAPRHFNLLESKEPIRCPHQPCRKMIAVNSFITHYKNEHRDLPKFIMERGKELVFPLDTTVIRYSCNLCLALITLTESAPLVPGSSTAMDTITENHGLFTTKIPIDTLFLMVTGSEPKSLSLDYVMFWLFTAGEHRYQARLDIASRKHKLCVSTRCAVNLALENRQFANIADKLDCLMVTASTFKALLKEGLDVSLRITVF